MTLLWLVAPLVMTGVVLLVIRLEYGEFAEANKRDRALQKMSASDGRALRDEDASEGWFVSKDGEWPRRVRIRSLGKSERSLGRQEVRFDDI